MQSMIDTPVDGDLIDRSSLDDREAFGTLYDRHSQRVFAHCARQLGGLQDADDITAIVFLEAWRLRARIRIVSGSALPWLLMTATNVARNHRPSARRFRAVLSRIPAPTASPDHSDAVAAAATFEATHEALVVVGGTAAAWVAVSRPEDTYSVYCSASLTTDSDVWKQHGASTATNADTGLRSPLDAIDACAAMWRTGPLARDSVPADQIPPDSVPSLTACVVDGQLVVYPGSAEVCAQLQVSAAAP